MHPVAILLPRSFDVQRLQQDLAAVSDVPQVPQPGEYHAGEWTGVSLHSQGGRADSAQPWAPGREEYRETELMQRTPYLRQVLETLPCPKTVVRLLTLPPGGVIQEHRDDDVSFQTGALRLHAPIVTHPDVEFHLGGQRMGWKAGELWFGDFSQTHSVRNRSNVTRVHLVIDVLVTEELLDLFPPEYVAHQRARGIAFPRPRLRLPEEALRTFVCDFVLPPGVLDPNVDHPLDGSVRLHERELTVFINDQAMFALEPISDRELAIRGLPEGFFIRCEKQGGRITQATLIAGGESVALPLR